MEKRYLGDGVYVEFDGYHIVLTTEDGRSGTEDGRSTTNKIYLETGVMEALLKYDKELKEGTE